MAPSLLASPNAIPPRSSSAAHAESHLSNASPGASANEPSAPEKPVLRPVPESNWLAQTYSQRNSPPLPYQIAHPHVPPGEGHGQQQQSSTTTNGHTPAVASGMPPADDPPNPRRYETEDLDFTAKKTWTAQKEQVVRGPFDYVVSHPGKDFRSQLIAAFNAWLQVPVASLAIITRVIGMLHESSLLVDDVQDSSELRRGFPVAHHIFGVPQTINSANYIYFVALQELQKLGNPGAVGVFAEELVNLHRGQGMDLFWRDTLTCPTEDDYLEMVGNKTGGLFRLGIKLMQAESPAAVDCVPLVNLIGLIFQIRDDYMNLASQEYSDNKGFAEDLTEGKFSFPIIHSIRVRPDNLQLKNILRQKTADVEVKKYAVQYMQATGSFAYTRDVIATLIARARRLADDMDDGRGVAALFHKILDKLVVDR